MKRIIIVFLIITTFSCKDENRYKNDFIFLKSELNKTVLIGSYDYTKTINKINNIKNFIKDSVFLNKMNKTTDSLSEFIEFFDALGIRNYNFKNYDSLIKYRNILNPLIIENISICSYYKEIKKIEKDTKELVLYLQPKNKRKRELLYKDKLASYKRTNLSIQLTLHEESLILNFAPKFCYTISLPDSKKDFSISISDNEIQNLLSSWDGSLPSLVSLVKKNMKDESSFKHIQTGYINKGSYIEMKMIYSGKNSFNATVKSFIKVKVNSSGEVMDIISTN